MKPGDLIRLVDPEGAGVYVVTLPTGQAIPSPYSDRTLALFLGWHEVADLRGEKKACILIDGILGWVYGSEIEGIDETR
jgi:hypothetical protein